MDIVSRVMQRVSKKTIEDAENAIRDLFDHYNHKADKKEIDRILSSSSWTNLYGKGNLQKAFKNLMKDYIFIQGNTYIWEV
jgi:hypothetical protein